MSRRSKTNLSVVVSG